jgi:lysophospholipase L1-like esterase
MSLIKEEPPQELSKSGRFATWFSWAGVVASLLLFIYTYWRAEIFYSGLRDSIYFKYYLIALFFFGFWLLVLRLKQSLRINIVMISISLVAALYLSEGAIRLYQTVDIKVGSRTKIEVLDDFIASGINAVPAVRPRDMFGVYDKFLPLAGVSKVTTVGENETGKWMVYQSDRYGFNNPDSEWDATSVEWLLTGDSFTEGVAVQPGEDIAGQIRKLTQEHVINLGRSGNGPLMELAEIVEYAHKVEPKKVLWVYYEGNDLTSDLPRYKSSTMLMKYLDDGFSQDLVNRQPEIDKAIRKYLPQAQAQVLIERTGWIRLERIRRIIGFDVDVDVDVDDPLFREVLHKAKSRVEKWGGELYFVYLPEFERYARSGINHQQYLKKSAVLEVVKELNIPIIDIHQQVFSKHDDFLSLFPDRKSNHYNAKGYALVAEAIVKAINLN